MKHLQKSKNAADFTAAADDVFGRIATRYDVLCDLFSLGIHRIWKNQVAKTIAQEEWSSLLDGATGTGDIILRVLAHQLPPTRTIVASDISPQMLSIAQKRLGPHVERVRLERLDVESMSSIASASMDAYSISLGLKICNRHLALQEAMRILKPGGRLIVLEASNIPWPALHRVYLTYMSLCIPLVGWLATGGDASAYKYLLIGIRAFPSAEAFATELESQGFNEVAFRRLSMGIAAIHTARKPHGFCHI